MARDFVTRHRVKNGFRNALAPDADVHHGALGSFQQVGHFRGGKSVARLAVYADDDVTGPDPSFIGRRSHEGRHYHGVVLARRHLHSYAIIFSVLIFTNQREGACIKEVRVRIENAQHSGDSPVINGFVGVHGLGVILLDNSQHTRKCADGVLKIPGIGRRGPRGSAVEPSEKGGDQKNCCNQKKTAAFRLVFHRLAKSIS